MCFLATKIRIKDKKEKERKEMGEKKRGGMNRTAILGSKSAGSSAPYESMAGKHGAIQRYCIVSISKLIEKKRGKGINKLVNINSYLTPISSFHT
jgi:hypothetical protein